MLGVGGKTIKEQYSSPDIYWERDGKLLFKQDLSTKLLHIDYDNIWKYYALKNTYYEEVKKSIKQILNKSGWDKWKGYEPSHSFAITIPPHE